MAGDPTTPIVTVLLPEDIRRQVLSADAERQLAEIAKVRYPASSTVHAEELPELLDGAAVCLTGWGTPPLSEEVLATQPSIRLVAHTAGSIRRLLPLSAFERGIRVSHAAAIIADAVAELVISQALLSLRQLHEIDGRMKDGGGWLDLRAQFPGRLLGARTVGIVGAGYVGRIVIRLLKAFGCRVLVYDPLLTPDQATELGVETRSLDDLFAESDIVSLHAPVLPTTRGMVGSKQFQLLRDGALFINTARAALIDEDALLAELRSGRIAAGLDVFEQEPLPLDSPFRTLPNVTLAPHTAGHTADTHLRQGQAMVEEIRRFSKGEPLEYQVTEPMLANMA